MNGRLYGVLTKNGRSYVMILAARVFFNCSLIADLLHVQQP